MGIYVGPMRSHNSARVTPCHPYLAFKEGGGDGYLARSRRRQGLALPKDFPQDDSNPRDDAAMNSQLGRLNALPSIPHLLS
ncbi:uncharacterized protein SCHCODRAFT_02672881 [Schizophyllum commune H4-8]|uniref:Expressed protein n=1 Tax=Schizophyllum commune (strain H4-8 / FGSC 9210) TaxID=578458 RepID=D8QJ18_SCHCM|nr:uncharacterized protein SCHCODRAFT_02672881 [Schizophyllum commune H4-8]KAI5885785.1 hypothetical protein SCHCODRAFT_02672881 [Schizophyllum commune H4-8]